MSRELLREVASWPIEAKDDDVIRYFYEIDEIVPLLRGERNFVIGRKGTGKTAIAEHIANTTDYNVFAHKMSFKSFPFNSLYRLSDKNFTAPNQYISAWKLSMLSAALKLYSGRVDCDPKVKDVCAAVLPNSIDSEIRGGFSKLLERGANLSVAGYGVGVGGRSTSSENLLTNLVPRLEEFVLEHVKDGTYYILFDELDEDYKDILVKPDAGEEYFQLLTSLFKAAQDIRYAFSKSGARIVPVIFLRSDIYELLRDPDKNKWRDRLVDLNWNPSMLRRLFAYRTSKAIDADGDSMNFDKAWSALFSVDVTRYGNKQKLRKETFNYILDNTYLRPRDLVSYVRECARIALDWDYERISNDVIREADNNHSDYSRAELTDEIQSVLTDIEDIFDAFVDLRKPAFPYAEGVECMEKYILTRSPTAPNLSAEKIIELLFYFGVVGNINKSGRKAFSYYGPKIRLNKNDALIIHRSLLKSLQLY